MKETTREKFMHISVATIATALYKRGLRHQVIQGVHPVGWKGRNMVGPAFTLRYMPAREDRNGIEVFRDPEHKQRVAIETCPEGHVLVMDSRKQAEAASAGDILVTRLMKRGGAGVVTDGGFRDAVTIAGLDIPAYALKRLLNHKMRNDVTAGYIVTDVERLRGPMQQVTDYILARGAEVGGSEQAEGARQPA